MRQMRIAFYGPVTESTGYGAASRAYIHALHSVGVELSVVDINVSGTKRAHDSLISSLLNRRINPDFHLFHFYRPQLATILSLHMDRLIVLTTWETNPLPEGWSSVLNKVREVWVPCDYNVSVFSKHLSTSVFKCPHPVEPGFGTAQGDFSRLPQLRDNDFVFYSIIVWHQRKYPEGIIEAFLRAFPSKSDNVIFILKVCVPLPLRALQQRGHSDRALR